MNFYIFVQKENSKLTFEIVKQKLKMDYPNHFNFNIKGIQFHIRPIVSSDKNMFEKGFSELSERSRYFRFFSVRSRLSENQLHFFTEGDGINNVAWGISDISGDEIKPVGVGRFVRLKNEPETAEVALVIIDSYQKMGLGRILLSILNITAAQCDIKKLRYYILAENHVAMHIVKQFGILNMKKEEQVNIVDTVVYPNHKAIPESPESLSLIEIMKKTEEYMRHK